MVLTRGTVPTLQKKKLAFDRIDNHGPYAPWNCRWATAKEQLKNTQLGDEAVNERLAEQGTYQKFGRLNDGGSADAQETFHYEALRYLAPENGAVAVISPSSIRPTSGEAPVAPEASDQGGRLKSCS
jgi:hypothetical protein